MISFDDSSWFEKLEQLGNTPSGLTLARHTSSTGRSTYIVKEYQETIGDVFSVIHDTRNSRKDIFYCLELESNKINMIPQLLEVENDRVKKIRRETDA